MAENTIYNIQYDFDLNGKTITVPSGCTLNFDGGSLRNGTLFGQETYLVYDLNIDDVFNDVTLEGTFDGNGGGGAVDSVNGQTGVVVLGAEDVGAYPMPLSGIPMSDLSDEVQEKLEIDNSNVYIIEPSDWGITPGYIYRNGQNGYDEEDYTKMYYNARGVENAIQWAYENGYTGVKFKTDTYCFTPERPQNNYTQWWPTIKIYNLSNFDIDFGRSTLCYLLDSSEHSQYCANIRETDPTFNYWNYLLFVSNSEYITLHNGHLIGDRAVRKWLQQGSEYECAQEQTYGINIGAFTRFITVKDMEIDSFMGDGVCGHGDYYNGENMVREVHYLYGPTSPVSKAYRGRLKYNTNNLDIVEDTTNAENCTITNYVSLASLYGPYVYDSSEPTGVKKKCKEEKIYYLGNSNLINAWNRFSNIYPEIDVITYNSENLIKPIRIVKTEIMSNFKLLPNEDTIRLQFYYDKDEVFKEGEDYVLKQISIKEASPYRKILDNCYIHDNHRGGFAGNCYESTIQNCLFERNQVLPFELTGTYSYYSIEPGARIATRYHMGVEDNACRNLLLTHNIFRSNGGNAPCTTGNVALPSCAYVTISDNVFDKAGLRLGMVCDAVITNNKLYSLDFDNDRYKEDGTLVFDMDENSGCLYKKRIINISNNYIEDASTMSLALRNTILNSSNNYYGSGNFRFVWCSNNASFVNDTINIKSNTYTPLNLFKNCRFVNVFDTKYTLYIICPNISDYISYITNGNTFENLYIDTRQIRDGVDYTIQDCNLSNSSFSIRPSGSLMTFRKINNFSFYTSISGGLDNAYNNLVFDSIVFEDTLYINFSQKRLADITFKNCEFKYITGNNRFIAMADNADGLISMRLFDCKNADCSPLAKYRFGTSAFDYIKYNGKNPDFIKGTTAQRPVGQITALSGTTLPTNGLQVYPKFTFHLTEQDGNYEPGYYVVKSIGNSVTNPKFQITWDNETTYNANVPANALRSGTATQRLALTGEYVYNNLYWGFTFYDTTLRHAFYADVTRSGDGTEASPYEYSLDWIKGAELCTALTSENIGDTYFDIDLGYPIYVKEISSIGEVTWVDATGAIIV